MPRRSLLKSARYEEQIVRSQEKIKNEIKEKWYQMNAFSRPFELGYKDNERKDGVVLNRTYFIFFNTILGELFVHNLLTKGYDWVGSNFYNLPSSAQIFYRRFIKPARKPQAFKPGDEWRPERSVGNPAKLGSPKETLDFSPGSFILHHNFQLIEVSLNTIEQRMNFKNTNKANLIRTIEENSLNPLKRNGLILSYEKREGLSGLKYIITLPEKMNHNREGIDGS